MSETPNEDRKRPSALARYSGYAAVLLIAAAILESVRAGEVNVELMMAAIFVGFLAIMLRAGGSGGASGGVDFGGDGGGGDGGGGGGGD
jgi:hypothetical protein